MPRNGHSLKVVDDPKDLYDTLTQAEQDLWDQIGKLGYAPEKGSTGLWLAKKGKVTVGPAGSINALLDRVKEDVAEAKEFGPDPDEELEVESDDDVASEEADEGVRGPVDVETVLTEDHKGNPYLPGAEEIVDQQLKDAAFNEYTD